MLMCVRTTLNVDDDLLRAAKRQAAKDGRTLTSVVEDGLRAVLAAETQPVPRVQIRLPAFGGDGPAPGVDLTDPRAVRDAAFDEDDALFRAALPDAAP